MPLLLQKQGYSKVLTEENLDSGSLIHAIYDLWNNAERYTASMKKVPATAVCRL